MARRAGTGVIPHTAAQRTGYAGARPAGDRASRVVTGTRRARFHYYGDRSWAVITAIGTVLAGLALPLPCQGGCRLSRVPIRRSPLIALRGRQERQPGLSWPTWTAADDVTYRLQDGPSCTGTTIVSQMTQPSSPPLWLITGLHSHRCSRAVTCREMSFRPCYSRVDLLQRPEFWVPPRSRTMISFRSFEVSDRLVNAPYAGTG